MAPSWVRPLDRIENVRAFHLGGWAASRPCDWGTFASDATPPGMKRRSREDARDRQGVGADEGFAEAGLGRQHRARAVQSGIRRKAGVRRT